MTRSFERVAQVVAIGCGYPDVVRPLLALEKIGRLTWVGWADDKPELQGKTLLGRPVLGPINDVLRQNQDLSFVNTVGLSAKRRRAVCEKLEPYSGRAIAVIHPNVDTAFCTVSRGVLIASGVYLEPNVFIGCDTMILPGSTVGHDCTIGQNCFIGSGVNIGGGVKLGDYSWIGAGTVIHPGSQLGPFSVTSQGANIITKSQKFNGIFYEPPTKART